MGKHEIGNNGGRFVSNKEMAELSTGKQRVMHYSRKACRVAMTHGHHIVSIVSLHVIAVSIIEKVPHILESGGTGIA